MFRYLNGMKLVRIQAAQFFLIRYIRVKAVQIKVLRQIDKVFDAAGPFSQLHGGGEFVHVVLILHLLQNVGQVV